MAMDPIVVGASEGGLKVLQTILSDLDDSISAPIAIVIHRNPSTDGGLRHLLQAHTPRPVIEPESLEPIEAGSVYVAPAGYHLLLDGSRFLLTVDRPVNYARPSIDVLFTSAARSVGEGLTALLLSGGGVDGLAGLARIKLAGGHIIAQSPESAEAPDLPSFAIDRIGVHEALPPDEMAAKLKQIYLHTR